MSTDQLATYRRRLAKLFSGYRAEWLDEKVFELFTEPSYFPQLTTSHPCFIEGGRGTGKTTVLRCLSYEGRTALQASISEPKSSDLSYVGMYYRVNTNRVRAFTGSELPDNRWIRMFAHYINIELCVTIVRFLAWYSDRNPTAPALSATALQPAATSLHIPVPTTFDQFRSNLNLAKLQFEAAINNVAQDGESLTLSLQGAPIDALMSEVKKLRQFEHSSFFFLVDEYENLDNLQQRVMNTLIKHCGEFYSFKVGVRELGFRERSTLNPTEQLVHPADYKLINIASRLQERFPNSQPRFASSACSAYSARPRPYLIWRRFFLSSQQRMKPFGSAYRTPCPLLSISCELKRLPAAVSGFRPRAP